MPTEQEKAKALKLKIAIRRRRQESESGPQMQFKPEVGPTTPIPFDVPDFTVQERSLDTGQLEQRVPGFLERAQRGGEEERALISQIAAGAIPSPLSVPKFMQSMPGAIKGIYSSLPQIGAATSVGTLAKIDPSQGVSENISKAAGVASEEVAGAMVGGQVSSTISRMFPGVKDASKKLIDYAKSKNVRIDPTTIIRKTEKGVGSNLQKSLLANFARKSKGKQINQFMQDEVENLAPMTDSIENAVGRIEKTFKGIKEAAVTGKVESYKGIDKIIKDDTPVSWDNTFEAITLKLEEMKNRGLQGTKLYKRLKEMKRGTNKLYVDLDAFEKDLTNLARKESRVIADVKDIQERLNLDWDNIGQKVKKVSKDELVKSGVDESLLNAYGDKKEYTLREIREISKGRFKDMLGLSKLVGSFDTVRKSEEAYIRSLVNPNNRELLDYVYETNPELYKNIRNARLAGVFREAFESGKVKPNVIVKYTRSNQEFLKELYGNDGFKAIENFAQYVQDNEKIVNESLAKATLADAAREAVPALGLYYTGGAGPTAGALAAWEVFAGSMSMALTNPKNPIFKIFTAESPKLINDILGEASRQAIRASGMDQYFQEKSKPSIDKIFQVGPQGAFK